MSNKRLKIVMCGCHELGIYLIDGLIKGGLKLDALVSVSPRQAKLYKISGYRDFMPMSKKFRIPLHLASDYELINRTDMDFFKKNEFDLLIQGGWQRLIPGEVLSSLRVGAVGVHGSADFLPKGRGRSPLNWSLIEGKKRFIMHLFFMKNGVDNGRVFDTEAFDINEFDTIKTLYFKNAIVTKMMLLRSISKIADGTLKTRPQAGIPSYYPKRGPGDGLIDWENMDVYRIHDFIRAQTRPYPGAYGYIGGQKFHIWEAQVFDTRITYPGAKYGECVERFEKAMIVNCRSGLLLVKDYEKME